MTFMLMFQCVGNSMYALAALTFDCTEPLKLLGVHAHMLARYRALSSTVTDNNDSLRSLDQCAIYFELLCVLFPAWKDADRTCDCCPKGTVSTAQPGS